MKFHFNIFMKLLCGTFLVTKDVHAQQDDSPLHPEHRFAANVTVDEDRMEFKNALDTVFRAHILQQDQPTVLQLLDETIDLLDDGVHQRLHDHLLAAELSGADFDETAPVPDHDMVLREDLPDEPHEATQLRGTSGNDDKSSGGRRWGRRLGVPHGNNIWPEGRIRYIVDSSTIEEDGPRFNTLMVAIEELERYTDLEFVYLGYLDARPDAYVAMVTVEDVDGCYVRGLGYGTNRVVNLGWCNSPEHKGNMMHELLHLVGFKHQQQSAYRDAHIVFNSGGVPDGFASQYAKVSYYDQGYEYVYDYSSIMHYPGGDAMDSIPDPSMEAFMGQRDHLTVWDMLEVKLYYSGYYEANWDLNEGSGSGSRLVACQDSGNYDCPTYAEGNSNHESCNALVDFVDSDVPPVSLVCEECGYCTTAPLQYRITGACDVTSEYGFDINGIYSYRGRTSSGAAW